MVRNRDLTNEMVFVETRRFSRRYGAYVSFMKFNESVEDGLRKCFHLPTVVSKTSEKGRTEAQRKVKVRWYVGVASSGRGKRDKKKKKKGKKRKKRSRGGGGGGEEEKG